MNTLVMKSRREFWYGSRQGNHLFNPFQIGEVIYESSPCFHDKCIIERREYQARS
ncbi:MAG: hypothetical protein HXS44_10070 [Theionarchaea archaeon]|nr:hypothetical protein [Theionarchaea archaeon]